MRHSCDSFTVVLKEKHCQTDIMAKPCNFKSENQLFYSYFFTIYMNVSPAFNSLPRNGHIIHLYICAIAPAIAPPPPPRIMVTYVHISRSRIIETNKRKGIGVTKYYGSGIGGQPGKAPLKGGGYYVGKPVKGSVSFPEIGNVRWQGTCIDNPLIYWTGVALVSPYKR